MTNFSDDLFVGARVDNYFVELPCDDALLRFTSGNSFNCRDTVRRGTHSHKLHNNL